MFKRFLVVLVATMLSFGGSIYAKGSYSSGGGGRSYSSGGRSSSSSSSSGGSRSYSSGSSSPSKSYSSPSSSKSYSSGSTPSTPSSPSSSSSSTSWWSKKSASPALDSKAASSAKYAQAQTPQNMKPSDVKPTYKLSDPQVVVTKRSTFYSGYYAHPNTVYVQHTYHDSYNPYFWMWMMDRSAEDRAMWAYNHRADMDQQRLAEMRAKDADLDKRLAALEGSGVKADPNYKPAGVDDDLMYDKQPEEESSSHFWWWILGLGVVGGGVYLCFFRRWT